MCSAFGLDSFPKGSRERSPNPIVGVYKTGDDRFISLVMLQSDRYWPGLVTAGGRPELAEDPRFANAEARAKNNAECIAALDEMFASHTLAEWREILATQRGVWSVVQTPREVMEDPQVLANGYVQEVVAADGSTFKLVTTPLQFGEQPGAPTRAPGLGEHTEDVLQEVGLQMDEILDLKIKGAVL
jgi:crotonobetainyl-CoA:carnitine CoA-transferase CaiB-like acyl-CoA transferase